MKVSRKISDAILKKMKYTFNPEEFHMGMNVEMEHQDVTNGNVVKTAKIAYLRSMWRNKMALLKDLLSEVTSQVPRRVQLMRVEAVLENIAPQLKEADQKKLAEVYIELKQLAEMLNETPYTIFNANQWGLLEMVLKGKVAEFKLLAEDIAEDNKDVDVWPLATALDTVLI